MHVSMCVQNAGMSIMSKVTFSLVCLCTVHAYSGIACIKAWWHGGAMIWYVGIYGMQAWQYDVCGGMEVWHGSMA